MNHVLVSTCKQEQQFCTGYICDFMIFLSLMLYSTLAGISTRVYIHLAIYSSDTCPLNNLILKSQNKHRPVEVSLWVMAVFKRWAAVPYALVAACCYVNGCSLSLGQLCHEMWRFSSLLCILARMFKQLVILSFDVNKSPLFLLSRCFQLLFLVLDDKTNCWKVSHISLAVVQFIQ